MNRLVAVFLGVVVAGGSQVASGQGLNPCALLTAAEVQQAVPGSGPATNDHKLDKYGMSRCQWGRGLILVLGADDANDSPKDEASSLVQGFVDPSKPSAARSVRFETLTGVGDMAVAVVERRDQAKGVLNDAAILVVRRGKRQVSVMAPPIAQRERADALRLLSDLGKAIAKRLG